MAEEWIAQTAQDVGDAVAQGARRRARRRSCTAGSGSAWCFVNPALEALGWDPPRFMGTAFQNAWINDVMWNAIVGWIGLDQYDEEQPGRSAVPRPVARPTYGRRPEYCVPVVNRDLATVFLHAFADAHPLTPRGVKEALERVKMLPAASGAPGTYLSFGKWTRRGWMGAGISSPASSTPSSAAPVSSIDSVKTDVARGRFCGMDVDDALDFIREQHEAVMLTYRRDGSPQMSPITCNVDADGRVVVSTRETALKTKNLRRDPRVSLCVVTDGFYGDWIQVDGTAEVVSLPDAMEPLVDYYRTTAGEHPDWDDYRAAMVRDQRVIVRITPERAGPDRSG